MKHIRILSILLIALNIQCNSNIDNRIAEEQIENLNSTTKVEYIPKRINKCIELFEDGQPVYYKGAYGGYEEGKILAKTWADYLDHELACIIPPCLENLGAIWQDCRFLCALQHYDVTYFH